MVGGFDCIRNVRITVLPDSVGYRHRRGVGEGVRGSAGVF